MRDIIVGELMQAALPAMPVVLYSYGNASLNLWIRTDHLDADHRDASRR